MTAHPVWTQSQYDQIRVDCRLVCGAPQLRKLHVADAKNCGPAEAVRRTRKGPAYAF
jgi:hypothetical protein